MFKQLSVLLFLLVLSCHKDNPIDDSQDKKLQQIERSDHQYCISLGLDYAKEDDLRTELYWRCRLDLATYKFKNNATTGQDITNNTLIIKLIERTTKNLADANIGSEKRKNRSLDDKDHERCLSMGFDLKNIDQAKVEEYYLCRKKLADEFNSAPAFNNQSYVKTGNGYNYDYILDSAIERNLNESQKIKNIYPECAKYDFRSEKFASCKKAQDNARTCFTRSKTLRTKLDLEEKANCQVLVYYNFPSSMLRDEDKPQKLDKISDEGNVDVLKQVEGAKKSKEAYQAYKKQLKMQTAEKSTATKEEDDDNDDDEDSEDSSKYDLAKMKELNNKSGLYSRFELTRLRQKYIATCKIKVSKDLNDFFKQRDDECDKISKNYE